MAQQILVPVDASDPAKSAFEYACEQFPDASITALHVINPPEVMYGHAQGAGEAYATPIETGREAAEELFEELSTIASEYGATVDTEVMTGQVERTINEFVEDHDMDLVVIGSHGRNGFARVTLGSVAEKVVRRSPAPVLVVR